MDRVAQTRIHRALSRAQPKKTALQGVDHLGELSTPPASNALLIMWRESEIWDEMVLIEMVVSRFLLLFLTVKHLINRNPGPQTFPQTPRLVTSVSAALSCLA